MPYIGKEARPPIDHCIQPFIDCLKSLPVEEQDGALNYAVTKVLKQVYPKRYFHFNRALGVMEAIKQEFYRKSIAPYEEKKIFENGDVE